MFHRCGSPFKSEELDEAETHKKGLYSALHRDEFNGISLVNVPGFLRPVKLSFPNYYHIGMLKRIQLAAAVQRPMRPYQPESAPLSGACSIDRMMNKMWIHGF